MLAQTGKIKSPQSIALHRPVAGCRAFVKEQRRPPPSDCPADRDTATRRQSADRSTPRS